MNPNELSEKAIGKEKTKEIIEEVLNRVKPAFKMSEDIFNKVGKAIPTADVSGKRLEYLPEIPAINESYFRLYDLVACLKQSKVLLDDFQKALDVRSKYSPKYKDEFLSLTFKNTQVVEVLKVAMAEMNVDFSSDERASIFNPRHSTQLERVVDYMLVRDYKKVLLFISEFLKYHNKKVKQT